MTERDIEEPPDDVAEQSRSVPDDEDGTATEAPQQEMPLDVNEADAMEQSQAVGPDDEEYR